MKKLIVIGMGYVGIPAAVLFADTGDFQVVGIQRRSRRSGWKIELLNQGGSPFPPTEPGVADLIRRVVREKGAFRVSDDFEEIRGADCVLIDVQTPVEASHQPRYKSLREVTREVGRRVKRGALVCIESTVAPGTTQNEIRPILEEASGMQAGRDFHLAFSYERVMVGRLLHNIQHYPRIVGGLTAECAARAMDLYRKIVRAEVVPTNCLTAEIAKTVENAYRDVNIAFANEVALICESLGVDVFEVRKLVNNLPNDPSNPAANPVRNMHIPGAGVGGHCLPKDSWLLKFGVDRYGRVPVESKVIIGAREVNDSMPGHMADLSLRALEEAGLRPDQATVAILGYAFLENSDDTRNTPARPLIDELTRRGVRAIRIHDPFIRLEELPEVERDLSKALAWADCACIVTGHAVYRDLSPDLQERMRNRIFIDGRNILDRTKFPHSRIYTLGIGTLDPELS